jgi:hypothetical protein
VLTAASLIAQACQDAKVPNYTTQGLLKLNLILDELCYTRDFGLARGVYYFNLNPTLITTIAGITNYGGPYPLPLDYLRMSGSSGEEGRQTGFFFVYNGVPYPLLPLDLGRGDMLVQQAGIQNLPYAYYTDVSPESTAQDRISGSTTAATTSGSPTVIVASASNILQGMSMAGLGIAAGSVINNIAGTTLTLSLNATGTFAAASVLFGTPANLFVYPGPSGAFPTTLRYQQLKPPIIDTTRVPWFTDQAYLLERLTAELMATSDDTRRDRMLANAERMLGKYEIFADDKTSRAQTVQLDRNRFGTSNWSRLSNTKTIGW